MECEECVDWVDASSVIVDITQHPYERSLFRGLVYMQNCQPTLLVFNRS